MRSAFVVVVVALLVAGCGSKSAPRPQPADCRAACEHMLDLAMADLDKSMAASGDAAAIIAKLKAKAEASRDSDLANCTQTCMEGKLDTACARATTRIDDVTSCTNRAGGLH